MQVYLVRLHKNKEFVGIFAAERINNLFGLIDECCDPYACEFAPLGEGGLFRDAWAPKVPPDHTDTEFDEQGPPDYFIDCNITDSWVGKLWWGGELRWKRINPPCWVTDRL